MNANKAKKSEHSPAPQPERAIYGFFLLVSSLAVFLIYVGISLVPQSWPVYIEYLPDKYWSLAVPAFIALLTLFVVPLYCSLNAMRVNDLDSKYAIRDECSLTRESQTRRDFSSDSIDPIYDIDIKEINKFLFEN